MTVEDQAVAPRGKAQAGLDFERFNELLLESAGVGLAIAQPESLEVTFCNRRFSEWFSTGPGGGHRLPEFLPSVDLQRMATRLDEDRPFVTEAEVRLRNRPINLAVQISRTVQEGVPPCQNAQPIAT